MILKLLPDQIDAYWDVIQHAWIQTNPPPPGVSIVEYLNVLLENLLSGGAAAWIVYDEPVPDEKRVIAIGVTQLKRESLTGVTNVLIQCLYGLRKLDNALAAEAFSDFLKYARNTGAVRVKLQTSVPRVVELAKLCGCKREAEIFTYNLEV